MNHSGIGKWNIGVGLWLMAGFMIYGFVLIYLRDFAPDKLAWIEGYNVSPHFEARLAHVHGNLFSFLNIVFGFLLIKLPIKPGLARWASWLALAGLLMPLGILGEVYLGIPFYLVLVGGLSILAATIVLGVGVVQMRPDTRRTAIMTQPYVIMILLFALMAVLAALDSSFSSWGLMPWFNGLRWLRVHFISLGLLTETFFGLAPTIVATRSGRPRPATRWDIWLTLNAGLLILLIGIPLVNGWLIFIGGTAVFVAVGLLLAQLYGLRAPRPETPDAPTGLRFYLAGLSYLLLGIIVGTGLWLGWGPILAIQVPIEVHIHANNWGFLSLTFVGLMVDLYPGFAGRPLARPRSFTAIFWMMTAGALLLVLGPWVKNELLSVPGIVLHLGATGWLLANMIAPIQRERASWGPGIWHLISAYMWIIAPVLVAPLILLDVPGFPGAGIEQNAPQALIYGWVLQFGIALIPYVVARWLRPGRPAALGGSWLSLAALHTGSVLLWVSIFVKDYQGILRGGAYLAWVVALLPLVAQLLRLVREHGAESAALEVGDGVVAPGD